tara:strand:+ start:298 stop:507 length:210 start_codon:yes stop_codon:yes gene_type:complete
MSRAEKLQEIKELRDYLSTRKTTTSCSHMYRRIEWLEKNLDTKQSKEERQMLKESKARTSSKTLSFNLN